MSIASEVTRIVNIRKRIATKLASWGLVSSSTATLQECKDGLDQIDGTKYLTNTNVTDVKLYKYVQIKDDNLKADNIKKNVTVLGIKGTYDTTTPSIAFDSTLNIVYGTADDVNNIVYTPASGKNAFPAITFSLAPNDTCALIDRNIKKDVSILGVRGTYDITTMRAAHNHSNPGSLSYDHKTLVCDLFHVDDDTLVSPTEIKTEGIQMGWLFMATNPWHPPGFAKCYVIRADFGISKTTNMPYMTIDVMHRTFWGADKLYRLEVNNSEPYKIKYYVDNFGNNRAHLE